MIIKVNQLAKDAKNNVEVLFFYRNSKKYQYLGVMSFNEFQGKYGACYVYSIVDSLPDALTVFIGIEELAYQEDK